MKLEVLLSKLESLGVIVNRGNDINNNEDGGDWTCIRIPNDSVTGYNDILFYDRDFDNILLEH